MIVPPQRPGTGHWFGGGNLVKDPSGTLWLVGRYRNQGDSRTGLGKGERGLEMAVFRSDDDGQTFQKAVSWSKSDLNTDGHEVLSIEGTALRIVDGGVQLFLSTEKTGIDYPSGLEQFLKPGTGVWTVDRIVAADVPSLASGSVETILSTRDPRFIQVKDPFVFDHQDQSHLLFCTHPFCWSSSNTGKVPLATDGTIERVASFDFFPRGFTWDVAMTRGTAIVELPSVGILAGQQRGLFFYDGGECVRNLDEHQSAVARPRGYSCEELGGAAVVDTNDLARLDRLSLTEPLFVSPHGTGCSRYVDVLSTDEGYYVTWQQSQDDGSQPLVLNFVPRDEILMLLAK
ncbi:hypothetical protein K239x_40340 [Planctomycetes bacterium K23_9]|uniref:Exo-alpha-sialidase n=1 Tax=Stieleria marina TaxID=1930275 RepID=A0A517NY37_9BACT|nr:hypothetical protein K239x_40340 [Planctomycetes bacterium K23_9]